MDCGEKLTMRLLMKALAERYLEDMPKFRAQIEANARALAEVEHLIKICKMQVGKLERDCGTVPQEKIKLAAM